MSATIDTWTGRLGLLTGIFAVAAWLVLTGKPAAAPAPAASVRVAALVNGELGMEPLGEPILRDSSLRPGRRGASGTLRVRNQTPLAADFAVRTKSTDGDLDGAGWIEIADGGKRLLRTTLATSHAWSAQTLRLASGESRKLRVRVWIPDRAPDGWQAARGDVSLEFSSNAGARR
jgi:hypothetical protein